MGKLFAWFNRYIVLLMALMVVWMSGEIEAQGPGMWMAQMKQMQDQFSGGMKMFMPEQFKNGNMFSATGFGMPKMPGMPGMPGIPGIPGAGGGASMNPMSMGVARSSSADAEPEVGVGPSAETE